ncbi:hypothetical protein [Lewinella sp. 4G2]|uniref:hypothetical protein n=1 Tax=Lewinella sp. 4G2 TaxID=1803372 RepID=UPI0007B49606|nr:hypothetical protein [Lewinella sp. 4G2]OAV45988.1 hypothetical protein A3850_019020 [Lewinella sp. 4G2]
MTLFRFRPFLGILSLFLLLCTSVSAQDCDLGTEDWETGSNANPPAGWTRVGSPNQAAPCSNCGEIDGRAQGFNTVGEGMISPELTCVGTVTFDWHSSSNTGVFTVEVQWSQTPSDEASWQTFETINATGIGPDQKQYMEVVADLPEESAVAPFGIFVRWIMTARTSSTFYLDNICFTSGTCTVQPTQIQFTQLPPSCIEVGAPFTVTACATDDNGFIAETYSENILVLPSTGTVTGGGANPPVAGCVTLDLTATSAGNFSLIGSSQLLMAANEALSAEEACPNEIDVRVMAYNLLNFPNGRDRCEDPNDIVQLNRQDTLAKIVEHVEPDVIMVCELQDAQGSADILTALQGIDPNYAAATFVENTSTIVKNLNNMLYYNSAKMTLVQQSVIETNTRDVSRYRMQMNDPKIATAPDTVFVNFYVMHTKAGSAPPDSTRRANDVATFQAAFDQLPVENAVFGGDLNFYTDTEAAYQTLLNGANPWFDPVDAPGEWDNNPAFSDIHTQASRASGSQSYDCGIPGGLDSRFDFLMYDQPINDEAMGVEYLDGTYDITGNDGNLFNQSINDIDNMSGVPRSVLDALFFMSDHLPVTMDLRVTFPLQELPVTLAHFGADAGKSEVRLNWDITEETGFSHYVVERLAGEDGWTKLGEVAGGRPSYVFTDESPTRGNNFYRLRMVDLDGAEAFSPVRSVRFGEAFTLYPTVTSGQVFLKGADSANLSVYDGLGRRLEVPVTGQGFSLAAQPSGWYTVVGNGEVRRVFRR